MAIPRLPLKTLRRNLAQRSQPIDLMETSWAFMGLFIFPPHPWLENQPSQKKEHQLLGTTMPTNFNWIINQDIMKVGMFHANPQPMM
jgi:hypothetical protein